MFVEAFAVSTALVAIGEIGDKTQLLSFALAQRYRSPWPIMAGVLLATLLNHALSAWLGNLLAGLIDPRWLTGLLGVSFILLGLWMLIPDKDEELGNGHRFGPFVAAFVLFFIAEIGDKTQLATIALAARFPEGFMAVVTGSALGMMLANIPVIWLGARLISKRGELWAHRISAGLFVLFGAITLLALVW
ncbi:TMEM165/GDT1 family protein [Alcanivorax quisquiliarum]|uniref:GDT1 family protein n=1 Tax=Alcanivorax quisquiliarum TaxID=2933565 RepID=A0ABT0E4P3_9GAMM|nr:TMEM165/GDT1 family protein [Alcanivorax quisquiliarum]MCK0536797.1 TMEM165/GDT1 family protein [Alcanivorax quisquiliarum]